MFQNVSEYSWTFQNILECFSKFQNVLKKWEIHKNCQQLLFINYFNWNHKSILCQSSWIFKQLNQPFATLVLFIWSDFIRCFYRCIMASSSEIMCWKSGYPLVSLSIFYGIMNNDFVWGTMYNKPVQSAIIWCQDNLH